MKAYHRVLFLSLAFLTFVGCKKSEIPFYNEKFDAVRFPYSIDAKGIKEPAGYIFEEKTFYKSYSFFSTPDAQEHIDSIPLYLIGIKSGVDRKVNVEVAKDASSSADFFEIISATIPANKTVGNVKIKLKNRPELKTQPAQITLLIKNSEALLAGPSEFTKAVFSWGIRLDAPVLTRHFMSYNALIQSPERAFSESRDYFSLNALEVIVKALEWKDWDNKETRGESFYNKDGYKYLPWNGVITKTYPAYAKKIADYIEDYNKKHPNDQLKHDGGKLAGQPIKARTEQ